MGILLTVVLIWFILTLLIAFFKHHADLVQACQTDEELVALIKADAALHYPPSSHPSIEIATRREPTPNSTPRPPWLDKWAAALLTRDNKSETVALLSVTDKTLPLFGTMEKGLHSKALRLLARKVKEALKEAEKEREWAKMREESGECEWRVHGGGEEFEMLRLEEGKGGGL